VCDSTTETGPSLDWIAGGDTTIRFRGWFKRHNAPTESGRLSVATVFLSGGSTSCDVFAANLIEAHSGKTIIGMGYTHATRISGSTSLTTTGGGSLGYFNQVYVGNMVNDTGCPTTGVHAHETMYLGSIPGYLINEIFPHGDYFYAPTYCPLNKTSTYCKYQNNTNWSRYIEWGEGS